MTARAVILVCTCDRPDLLRKLLAALTLPREGRATICIVDNGTHSSEPVTAEFRQELDIRYRRVGAPGLVAARNAGLRLALEQEPDFIAFIDDDEYPEPGWLGELLRVMRETGADFVTGPVIPGFAVEPPAWAVKGRYFHNSGNALYTSNLMIRSAALPDDEGQWFHADFDFLGGEDNEFLGRLAAGGAIHAIAPAAAVHEFIPAGRLRRRYIWRRGLRDGMAEARIARLRKPGARQRAASLGRIALLKLGYAANHLVWTPLQPFRINNAMADLGFIAGILLASGGAHVSFYGRRPADG